MAEEIKVPAEVQAFAEAIAQAVNDSTFAKWVFAVAQWEDMSTDECAQRLIQDFYLASQEAKQ